MELPKCPYKDNGLPRNSGKDNRYGRSHRVSSLVNFPVPVHAHMSVFIDIFQNMRQLQTNGKCIYNWNICLKMYLSDVWIPVSVCTIELADRINIFW